MLNIKAIGTRKSRYTLSKLSLPVVSMLAALGVTPAYAIGIDVGNPDIKIQWDNSVRYNAIWRMKDINPHFYNNAGTDETEGQFKKHDLVANRLDLLSEFDLNYKDMYGARVSAALWSENAYDDHVKTNPAITGVTSQRGVNSVFSGYAKRFITGSSGEILDAFVFGNIDIGDTTLRLKVGQHNVYWGEAMFTAANNISNSIGPMDTIKASSSPGSEVKELFMPTNQASAQWTLTDTVSLLGYYQADWKPYRLAASGTFFASSDGGGNAFGADPLCAAVIANPLAGPNGMCMKSLPAITPGRNGGDFGVGLRYKANWWGEGDGTLGFYYRKYDEKIPWSATQLAAGGADLGSRLSFARDTEMFGVSLVKMVDKVSLGAEVSRRHNTALATPSGFTIGTNNGGAPVMFTSTNVLPTYEQVEGARGDTWHALINGVYLLPKTALWEAGSLAGELSYQRLDKVTKNANVYFGEGYAGCKGLDKTDGCATKDAWSLNLSFTPQWAQVFPSWDLSLPMSASIGLKGNTSTLGGTYENSYTYSIGLKGTYRGRYEVSLLYSDPHVDYKTKIASAFGANPGFGPVVSTSQGSSSTAGIVNSHAWLGLTVKANF